MEQRERDEKGRPRNERPRDGLGRPLPRGAIGVPRAPEGLIRTPSDTVAEAQRLFDAGMPFHAHEVLEDAWRSAPEAERSLWQGLAQLAVALTHLRRGNQKGARTLLARGSNRLRPFAADPPHGLDVRGLLQWSNDVLLVLDSTGSGDAVSGPRLAG
ncbi:DUF309 domain-containing protein [Rhodococcus sp. NPDC004095]